MLCSARVVQAFRAAADVGPNNIKLLTSFACSHLYCQSSGLAGCFQPGYVHCQCAIHRRILHYATRLPVPDAWPTLDIYCIPPVVHLKCSVRIQCENIPCSRKSHSCVWEHNSTRDLVCLLLCGYRPAELILTCRDHRFSRW